MKNEFIVWDNEFNRFMTKAEDYGVMFAPDGRVCFDGVVYDEEQTKRYEKCNYIGLKDTNNNKIYADSSIVEFEHKSIKQIGIVKYSIDFAYYYFDIKNGSGYIPLYMVNFEKIKDFKIIDTIQQNKLGLIK